VQEALALWEERERQRTEFLLTLEDARASLSHGEGRVITQESVRQLAQEVKNAVAPAFSRNCPSPAEMAHRIAPRAETDLDDIWLYVARDSGSIEIANRLIDTITDRFFVLGSLPRIGRSARKILDPDFAACPWAST
jgi:hypothetical protein